MRNRITYGQSLVLCSQPPSYQSNLINVSGLKRVQDCSISFDFNRQRFKQVGSENFVGDTHTKNANISLDLTYFYSNGTNEALMGLNVDGSGGHALKYVKKQNQDRNYYIIHSSGDNQQPSVDTYFTGNYDVMALGNVFIDGYSISAKVNEPITVNASLSAYNLQLDNYNSSTGELTPSINESNGTLNDTYRYQILTGKIKDTTNLDYLIDAALSPSKIEMVLPSSNVAGLSFSGQNVAHLQSFDLGFKIDRHDLYGFGSMYPYGRRAILPILGSLSFSAIASEFTTGSLHNIINSGESSFDFTFNCLNCSGQTGLQLTIENANIDGQSYSESIGDNATIDVRLSFPLSNTTGFRISTPPLILGYSEDGSSSLNVSVTGKSPFTYSWRAIDSDTELASGPTYSPTGDGYYYCAVFNELGSGVTRNIYANVP